MKYSRAGERVFDAEERLSGNALVYRAGSTNQILRLYLLATHVQIILLQHLLSFETLFEHFVQSGLITRLCVLEFMTLQPSD